MTPTDPWILAVVPVILLLMVAIAAPLENTETGRRFCDWILERLP